MGWCLVAPSMAPSVEGRVYVEDAGRTYRENGAAAGRVGVLPSSSPQVSAMYGLLSSQAPRGLEPTLEGRGRTRAQGRGRPDAVAEEGGTGSDEASRVGCYHDARRPRRLFP
jgi:hypothetical protein